MFNACSSLSKHLNDESCLVPSNLLRLMSCFAHNRIYATPSTILRQSGSAGVALLMWVLGASIAACGTAVYMELGTVSYPVIFSETPANQLVRTFELTGSSEEWRREELPRVHLPPPEVPRDVCVILVCSHIGAFISCLSNRYKFPGLNVAIGNGSGE